MRYTVITTNEVIEQADLAARFPNTAVNWYGPLSDEFLTSMNLAKVAPPAPAAPPLDNLKAAKNLQINAWREAANLSTFTHQGKLISCDPLSRSDIDGVANNIALFGAFPAGFPGGWKAVDDTYLALADVNAFKAMYASMTAQGTANFSHAQALKAQLANASTPAQVDAIVW